MHFGSLDIWIPTFNLGRKILWMLSIANEENFERTHTLQFGSIYTYFKNKKGELYDPLPEEIFPVNETIEADGALWTQERFERYTIPYRCYWHVLTEDTTDECDKAYIERILDDKSDDKKFCL